MEDTAVRRRLVRQANRMQVLLDLAKATSDSLQDLVAAESWQGDHELTDVPPAPGTADRLVGSGAEQTLGAPSTGPAQDPLARRTITRGTVLGILDRLDDALERNEQLAAAASSRDLRHFVDDLPL
jgi:hypothetical protein